MGVCKHNRYPGYKNGMIIGMWMIMYMYISHILYNVLAYLLSVPVVSVKCKSIILVGSCCSFGLKGKDS